MGRVALGVWAALVLVVSGSLASAHWYALPRPDTHSPFLARALAASRPVDRLGRWSAFHVLYAECQCSRRLMTHLVRRGALRDLRERVLLVGEDAAFAAAAAGAGYEVEPLTPRELETRYGIVAAPLFIVSDPHDEIRYLGGYTAHKQGLDIRDLAIVSQLRQGAALDELPLLGCAVSRSLQKLIDPLGLR